MSHDLSEDALSQGRDFWAKCARLIELYPERPSTLSRDSELKQLERQIKTSSEELAPLLCPNDEWLTDASVGKGNWAAIPWVAIFDSRESTSAQQGVYPVIHLSPDEPVGLRLGLGVSATAFKGREDQKAADVRDQIAEDDRGRLVEAGFVDVIGGSDKRVQIGGGKLARQYAKGMVFERFVSVGELKSSPDSLTESLQALLDAYKAWIDHRPEVASAQPTFLEIMRRYADEHVVFLSPNRQARYSISDVDDSGCRVSRLDANESVRVTASGFEAKRELLRNQGGRAPRQTLDATIAIHMCYLQGPHLSLAADRKTAVYLPNDHAAAEHFDSLINAVSSPQLYKPVILALVIEAIRDGELADNRIEFDWLLPRFVERLQQHGRTVTDQQLAQGFARLAGDIFWLLAHVDPGETISLENPTPSQIRQRISHAQLQEPFWRALQKPEHQQRILDTLARKWWPDMTPSDDAEIVAAETAGPLAPATERLIASIAERGFIYHPWQIAAYITALRTKPFVILAGVSGTGKSKLPALVAEQTGGQMTRVSVRPDWTDSSDVLGYVDLNDTFRPGVVLDATSRAAQDRDRYHVCLVDEMNLARVEHYFAEVLSTIEDRKPADGGGFETGPLLAQNLPASAADWQAQNIPANLGIVGTVNMDESSHGFSRKVLDRAFTIELSEVDLTLIHAADRAGQNDFANAERWPLEHWQCRATRAAELDMASEQVRAQVDRAIRLLVDVNHSLVHSQLQVGYRTRDEIILFLVNAEDIVDTFRTRDGQAVDPLDLAIMMKVLPRLVGGSNAIRKTLAGLLGLALHGSPLASEDEVRDRVEQWETDDRPDAIDGAKLPRTAARLCLMCDRLESEGYTSFWL